MRRLLSLDYLVERPTLGWLPTEEDKVRQFEALGLDRRAFPYRKYGTAGAAADPALLRLQAAHRGGRAHGDVLCTSMPGRRPTANCARGASPTRRSGLRCGLRLSPCTSSSSARAPRRPTAPRPVLKSWTQDGDGQGAPDPAARTQADPDIRHELARLDKAVPRRRPGAVACGRRMEHGRTTVRRAVRTARGNPHHDDRARGHRSLCDLEHHPAHQSRGGDVRMRRRLDRPPGQRAGQRAGQPTCHTDSGGGVATTSGGGVARPPSLFRRRCSGLSS